MANTSGRFSRFPAVNREAKTTEAPAPVEEAPAEEPVAEDAPAPKKSRKKAEPVADEG